MGGSKCPKGETSSGLARHLAPFLPCIENIQRRIHGFRSLRPNGTVESTKHTNSNSHSTIILYNLINNKSKEPLFLPQKTKQPPLTDCSDSHCTRAPPPTTITSGNRARRQAQHTAAITDPLIVLKRIIQFFGNVESLFSLYSRTTPSSIEYYGGELVRCLFCQNRTLPTSIWIFNS